METKAEDKKEQSSQQKTISEKTAKQLSELIVRSFGPRHLQAKLDKVNGKVREAVIKSVDSLFTEKPVGLLIMGAIGCGKTSLLKLIYERYTEQFVLRLNGQDFGEYVVGEDGCGAYVDSLQAHT